MVAEYLAAAGGDILGGLLASRAQRKAQNKAAGLNARQRAAAFAYLQRQQGQDRLFGQLGRNQLLGAHKAELGGFQGAERALGLGALQARQTVQGQHRVNLAEAEQSAVSRGLLGTSTGMQGLQGVGDQTTASLAAIDTGLAQQLATLGLERGGALGRQGRELAALAQSDRDIEREYGYELASLAPMAPGKKKKRKGFFKDIGRMAAAGATLGGSEIYRAVA